MRYVYFYHFHYVNTSPLGALQTCRDPKRPGRYEVGHLNQPHGLRKRFCKFFEFSFSSFSVIANSKKMWAPWTRRRGKFENLNWPIRATKVNQDSLWNLPTDQSWLSKFRLDFAKKQGQHRLILSNAGEKSVKIDFEWKNSKNRNG